jgi:chromosome segregation ATPase
LESIPVRVDEVSIGKPVTSYPLEHYLQLEDVRKLEIGNLNNKKRMSSSDKIDGIRNSIEKEKNKIEKEKTKLATEIAKLNIEIQNEEFLLKKDTQEKINSTNKLVNNLNNQLSDLEIELKQKSDYNKSLVSMETERDELRIKWLEISKETIDIDSHSFCSFCEQKLPEDKINKIIKKFDDTKKNELEKINIDGQKLKNEIAELNIKIQNENQEKTGIESKIATLQLKIKTSKDLIKVMENSIENVSSEKIDKLNEEIKSLECLGIEESTLHNLEETLKELEINDSILLERIDQEIDLNEAMLKDTQREIAVFAEIEKADKRILELITEQKQYAETYQELSKELFETEEVIKEIVSKLESEINNNFKITRFNLFEIQINGGLKEICEATDLNGTPYSSLNTGMSINCGLDIINTLCKIYKVNFPIFIDNAESINEILKTKSQQIQLVVVKPFATERINKYGKIKKTHLTEEQKKINKGELIISKI